MIKLKNKFSCEYKSGNLLKKAAMFGLDARIALAIFGALSVISGAALYSAIQQSKATSILVKLKEVGKAWEQYYLDTGAQLTQVEQSDNSDDDFYRLKLMDLSTDPGVIGWSGPYVSYSATSQSFLKDLDYGGYTVNILRKDLAWGESSGTSWPAGKCSSGNKCQIWIMLHGIPNESMAKIIDQKVDNADGSDAGSFRWWLGNDSALWRYHLEYAPVPNPND